MSTMPTPSYSYSNLISPFLCSRSIFVSPNFLSSYQLLIRLGANMPARTEHVSRSKPQPFLARSKSESLLARSKSEPLFVRPAQTGEVYDVILYFGIIDVLLDYDISKKLEHAYKSLQADPSSISAVDPKLYSTRFRDFVHRIFSEDE